MATGVIRTELLGVADAVAREKGIEREFVLEAMELALQKASRARYGFERDIRTHIDRKSGEIVMKAYREVVNEIENEDTQIRLAEAKKINPAVHEGDFIIDDLPPFDFGRVAAQTVKQVIFQRIRDAERQRQYDEYKDRVGEVINGLVKRSEFGNVMVDMGRCEAILLRDQLIPRESFRAGDRVRAYIADVRNEPRGSQIFLSRTHPQFMAKLFAQEVPEIYDNHITIKAVARDPGSRAKMAVYTGDKTIDPIGACVGMRGSRVQAVTLELRGEKVDIVPWSDNPAVFVVNALVPAEVTKVVLDEDTNRVEVIVPDDQLSLAIGRRGQNVRLASQLTGLGIDVVSETQEAERRNLEVKERSKYFIKALDIEEVIAHLLIAEGFARVEEIAMVPLEDLMAIEGFEEELAQELQNRALTFIAAENERHKSRLAELNVAPELAALEGMTYEILMPLVDQGLRTLDDFADLSGDELCDTVPNLSEADANALIMRARAHWFDNPDKKAQ